MKGIKKALKVLSGATVVFLLSAGTDQSAVPNIVTGIAQTAWLAIAPILRDSPPAPQLRVDPARGIQNSRAAGSTVDGVAIPASIDASRVPTLTDAALAPTATDPAHAPAGAGSCGARCGGTTFSGPLRDSLTSAPRADVNGGRG